MVKAATPPLILVVDDDEGLLILMAEAFRAEGCQVATANSGMAALAWLETQKPDLMLLDLKMKDVGGQALIERLKQESSLVPFVVVTGQGDERVAVEVMKQGALDYVMKDTGLLDRLPSVVSRALEVLERNRTLSAAEADRRRLEKEILEISEHERHNIGAELHDGLGQQLTAAEFMCAALKKELADVDPKIAKRLQQIGGVLREAVAQTRSFARALVPVGARPDALQTGLAELAERTNELGGARCRLECREPVLLADPMVAGHLYRIAQEATNNATKHARASRVMIRLVKKGGSLLLEVSDDGPGLPKQGGDQQGLGLRLMQHRASVIGAELTIKSKQGEGVTIRCALPLKP